MEKYSQLPERTVPSSGRVKVHACKLYVTRTWTRSSKKFCPLVWSDDDVSASLSEEGEKGWEMFWFALPLEAALMSRGITGRTHTASLENIGGQERVGPLHTGRAASWYRRQLHDPHNVLQKWLSSLSSWALHNLPLLPRQWQGLRILHLIQLEKLLPLRHHWSKKNPQSLNQESSQRAGVWAFQSVQPEIQPSTSRHLCALALHLVQIGLVLLSWLCIKYYGWTMFAVISDRTEHF